MAGQVGPGASLKAKGPADSISVRGIGRLEGAEDKPTKSSMQQKRFRVGGDLSSRPDFRKTHPLEPSGCKVSTVYLELMKYV